MWLNWLEHTGLAHRGARRWARGRPELLADAEQEHLLALWLACQRGTYDPERCRPSTFIVSSLRAAWLPCRRTAEVVRGVRRVESLDAPIGDGDADATLHDLLAGEAPGAEDLVGDQERVARLRVAVGELPALEREVTIRRFGLDGTPPRTLAEVACELELSAEGVRQLEARALRRLRAVGGAWRRDRTRKPAPTGPAAL